MATQTLFGLAPNNDSNTLLRGILYQLLMGTPGFVPGGYDDNTLLRGILYALQNGGGGGGTSPGHFDANGNIEVYDSVNNIWRPLTGPNGILTVT